MPGPAGDDHDDLDDDHGDEHGDDEHDDEPATLGSPPHPLDRIWRHPSELPARLVPSRGSTARRDLRQWWVALASAAAGAVATVVILAAFGLFDSGTAQQPPVERVRTQDAAVAQLVADIAPSIVMVTVVGPEGARRGSGVCVRHSGDILTSDRLVRDATRVTVTTHDGTERRAEVRGHDPATDLALLHVATGLEAAPVAQSPLHAGQSVLAVGTSTTSGEEPWVVDGIVASTDGVVAQLGGPTMDGLIATNASPGKEGMGGALLDRQGAVAGIVLAPIDGDSSTYAVPIDFAAEIADELITSGRASHGWLGVQGNDSAGVPTVTSTIARGPAARAGIRPGDVVVQVGDRTVATMGAVTAAVRWYKPKASVPIKVRRANGLVNFHVRMGSTPPNAAMMGA